MLERVRNWMVRHGMLTHGQRVLVAVSGGPDSVALLHILHCLAGEAGFDLHVFHMDHGLRGTESAGDARYVDGLATAMGVPCTVVALPPQSLKAQAGSLQANARAVRYAEMEGLARRIRATVVALGHNRDDQAETVLMRLLRGAGTRGLAGIPPIRRSDGMTFIRPLLEIARPEIEQYCRDHELFPRLDASNETPEYLRNRIRLELLPHLTGQYNPALSECLAQLAAVLRVDDDYLDGLAAEAFHRCRIHGDDVLLSGSALRDEPLALARRAVRLAAREAAGPAHDLGLDAVSQVLEAVQDPRGSRTLNLVGGLSVSVEYGVCRFHRTERPLALRGEWPVVDRGVSLIPELGLKIAVDNEGVPEGQFEAAFDADRLPGPVSVRCRKPGDRLWPTGLEGSKKLQDLLVDAKVPRRLRDSIPLLVAGEQILWVIGHRLDRRFLATPDSASVRFFRVTTLPPGEGQ